MQPFVVKVINKGGGHIQQSSVKRKEIINKPENGQYKKQRKENKQHGWKQNYLKIICGIAFHAVVRKKVMVLQGMPFKNRLQGSIAMVHRKAVANVFEQVSIQKCNRYN